MRIDRRTAAHYTSKHVREVQVKIGLGLYRKMLNRENYRFARQMGCTHIVIHLVDYDRQAEASAAGANQPVGTVAGGWGIAGDPGALWTTEELLAIRKEIESEGLKIEAIENFDPVFWHDILLDGPKKAVQLEGIKRLVRSIGKAGIPIMGYNFSIAGVAGRVTGRFARGGAESVGVHGVDETPLPLGMVWNMIYDRNAPKGTLPSISSTELWQRFEDFLKVMLPVAEEAGVKMALHPDDPPAATVRSTPRLVYKPEFYQRVIDIDPSPSNMLEFCLGTIAEMADGDVYEATERYSRQGRLAYVHFRNVRGKIPDYEETFVDEGDVDMFRILRILKRNHYSGVIIPDHTPLPDCGAPWHAGMAYALGYIRAALRTLE